MELLIRTRPTQGIKIHLCGMENTLPYRWNIYIKQLDNIKLLDISGVSYMSSVFLLLFLLSIGTFCIYKMYINPLKFPSVGFFAGE